MMHFSNGLNTNDRVPPSVLQEPDSLGLKNRGGKKQLQGARKSVERSQRTKTFETKRRS